MHTIYVINNDVFVKGEVFTTGKEMLDLPKTWNRTRNGTMHGTGVSFTERLHFINVALFPSINTD